MSARLLSRLAAAKSAVIAGKSDTALTIIEEFSDLALRNGISAAERPILEARLAEIRLLSEASLRGAQMAIAEVQMIVTAARSLQTYDDSGRLQVATTVAPSPRRF